MKEEIHSLKDNETFDLTPLPEVEMQYEENGYMSWKKMLKVGKSLKLDT